MRRDSERPRESNPAVDVVRGVGDIPLLWHFESLCDGGDGGNGFSQRRDGANGERTEKTRFLLGTYPRVLSRTLTAGLAVDGGGAHGTRTARRRGAHRDARRRGPSLCCHVLEPRNHDTTRARRALVSPRSSWRSSRASPRGSQMNGFLRSSLRLLRSSVVKNRCLRPLRSLGRQRPTDGRRDGRAEQLY